VSLLEIVIVGDFSNNKDEGLKNVAKSISKVLESRHNVYRFNIKKILLRDNIQILFKKSPDIVHIISSPTIASFIVAKIFAIRWPSTKVAISALHHGRQNVDKLRHKNIISKFLRTDIILYQAVEYSYVEFCRKNYYFPNGVDINVFKPLAKPTRSELRSAYGIPMDAFVILHVGHQSKIRNIGVFSKIKSTIF